MIIIVAGLDAILEGGLVLPDLKEGIPQDLVINRQWREISTDQVIPLAISEPARG